MKKHSSTVVNLILLGSAASLYGCDEAPVDLQQKVYNTQEECAHDWGQDPRNCTRSTTPYSGVTGSGGYYYYGPRYYWDSSGNRPVAVESDGTERAIEGSRVTAEGSEFGVSRSAGSFSRGGFGESAHGFGGEGAGE